MLEKEKIKRIIFDLDYTLLYTRWYSREAEFYKEYIPGVSDEFANGMFKILTAYEENYDRYDQTLLLNHLNKYCNVKLDRKFLFIWDEELTKYDAEVSSSTKETLKYLKNKYELVILTNWFESVQIERMKNAGLYEYFDEIYAGDDIMKPNKESYLKACSMHKPS
jgi:Predicted hydrolase (HAD superfamily)